MKCFVLKSRLAAIPLTFLLVGATSLPAQLKLGQQPELFVQSGHTGVTLSTVAISKNPQLLASGGSDGQLVLWNPATGLELRAISAQAGPLMAIALSGDGAYVASSGTDGRIALHDTATGAMIKEIDAGKLAGSAIALSIDGTLLAWSNGSAVELWNKKLPESPQQIATLSGSVSTLAFTGDGSTLAAGSDTGSVDLVNVTRPSAPRVLQGHTANITSIAFSQDGKSVASGSYDKTIRIWSLTTDSAPRSISIDSLVWSLAFIENSQVISVGTNEVDKSVHVTRVASDSGQVIESTDVPLKVSSFLFEMMGRWPNAISSDGSRLAFGADFSTIALWNVAKHETEQLLRGATVASADIAISPDRRWLAVAVGRDVQIWNVSTGTANVIRTGYGRSIRGVTFTTRSDAVATISDDEQFDAWDLLSGKSKLHLRGGGSKYVDPKLVGVINKANATVSLWSLESFDFAHPRIVHLKRDVYGIDRLSISEGGKWLASATQLNGEIHVWNLATGEEERTVTASGFHFQGPMKFTADENLLAWPSSDGSVKVLDIRKGDVRRFCCHEPKYATSLAFSSSGDLMASGGLDAKIRIWNLASLNPSGKDASVATLQGHTGAVRSLLFVLGKPVLISTSEDGTTRVWQLHKGKSEEAARLISMRSNSGWLVVTKEGLFDGTADAIRYVSWRIPLTTSVFPLGAFYNDFYHPGLSAEVFDGKKPLPCVDIAAILRLPGSRTMELQRALQVESRAGVPTLCLPERPDYSFFQNIEVTWKGLPVPVQASAFHEGDSSGCDYELSLPNVSGQIELNDTGANFSKALTNRCRRARDEPSTRGISCATRASPKGVFHVVTIAVSKYPPSSGYTELSTSVEQNAIDLAKFFRDRAPGPRDSYEQVHVRKSLLGGDATLDKIRQEFTAMVREVKEDDTVLVFLSGHGTVPPGQEEFYFVPVDGKRHMEAETGLSTAMLVDLVRDLSSKRVVLIVDACQSGGALDALAEIADAKASTDLPSPGRSVRYSSDQNDGKSLGIHVIAAATPFQSALVVNGADLFGETLLANLQYPAKPMTDICAGALGQLVEQALKTKTLHLSKSQRALVVSKGDDFVLASRTAVEKPSH